MDFGRAACAARGNIDDLWRDSLGCLIRFGVQAKRLADTRVSNRHVVDKLGIEPSMLKKRNRVHDLSLRGVATQDMYDNSAFFWRRRSPQPLSDSFTE